MTQQRGRSSQVAVNLPELLVRVDNDHELLCQRIGIFKEEFPRLLRSLRQFLVCEDMHLPQQNGQRRRCRARYLAI
jgi:hypothetical protein